MISELLPFCCPICVLRVIPSGSLSRIDNTGIPLNNNVEIEVNIISHSFPRVQLKKLK